MSTAIITVWLLKMERSENWQGLEVLLLWSPHRSFFPLSYDAFRWSDAARSF